MDKVTFYEHQMKEMAIFLAQLLREGIVYHVTQVEDHWCIELRGF